MAIRYGYDKHYQRGYFVSDKVTNVVKNRMYIWKSWNGFQLYRLTRNSLGVAINTALLSWGIPKNKLRKAAEVLEKTISMR